MDKKNTIFLTVIAVATLLVAVVGATFAYYSVQVSNDKTKVNVSVTSSSIGVLTLSTPIEHLYMNVTPTDMADYGENKSYFATTNENGEENTSNKSNTKNEFLISQLTVNGGNSNTSYVCNAKLRITLDVADESMGKVLKEGDVKLHLASSNVDINDYSTPLDLNEILTNGTNIETNKKYKEYLITYHVNENDKTSAEIKATLELINKTKTGENGDQKYLAGKNLNVDIEVITESENLDCSIVKKPVE